MRYKTHLLTSTTITLALTEYTNLEPNILLFGGVLIGSLLPDIDEENSFIGKRSLGISSIVHSIFGHRGFTHSLLAALLVFLPYFFWEYTFLLGLSLGYLLHIIGDFFSVSGVPLFWFFSKKTKARIKIPLYQTDHWTEKIIFFVSLCFFFFLIYRIFG